MKIRLSIQHPDAPETRMNGGVFDAEGYMLVTLSRDASGKLEYALHRAQDTPEVGEALDAISAVVSEVEL